MTFRKHPSRPFGREHSRFPGQAFTLVELFTVVGSVLVLILCLFIPARARQNAHSRRIACASNLKHIGLAWVTWAVDDEGRIPPQFDAARNARFEALTNGEVYRFFQNFSNEFLDLGWVTPRPLVCPSDTRSPARGFGSGISNSNISYFVGLDPDKTQPQMFLAGDRNITNGLAPVKGLLVLSPARPAGWTHELHNRQGNIALADGSVQQLASARLNGATNRIMLP